MPAESDAVHALDLIDLSGFKMNADCEAAHQIAQAHEGDPRFDAIHALIHRIEGDLGNATYWDRRAGTDLGGAGFQAELEALRKMVGGRS
jgi:hypothetical protein